MKIGIVSGEYPPDVGGVGDQAARLARELVARGHSVQVVTTVGPEHEVAGAGDGPEPVVLRAVPRWDWRLFTLLPRLAREGSWDVLHLHYQPGAFRLHGAINLAPGWLGRQRGAPAIVTTFHDLRVPYLFPKAGRLRQLAVRRLALSCQGIIAAEGEDVRRLQAWTAGRGGRAPIVRQVPLGNALDVPPPPDFTRDTWRVRLGLAPDALVAGHFGFVNRTKGVEDLVDAVARLVAGGRDVHLLMIGDPLGSSDPTNAAYLEAIRKRIGVLGLEGRVRWTGYVPPPDVAGWLRCLDVAVLPFAEGASRRRTSILAAWAAGVPVLTTTPAGDAGRTTESGMEIGTGVEAAATVPPGDPGALAAALEALLDDPGRRRALGEAGLRAAEGSSWASVAGATLGVYREAITRAADGPGGD
jgi:glycosyltransferase involved in cell wall biosynthesis